MAQVQKKINNADLPNVLGQTVAVTTPTGTTIKATAVANGPDGKTVLMKSNKYWFYMPNTYDAKQYLYTENNT